MRLTIRKTHILTILALSLLAIGLLPLLLGAQDLSGTTWRSTFDHFGAKGHITYHFTSPERGDYEYNIHSILKDYKGRGDFTYTTDDGIKYTIRDVRRPKDPDYSTTIQVRGQELTLSMPPRIERWRQHSPALVRKILDSYLSDMLVLRRQVP